MTAPLLIFAGHHRCASTWMDDILRAVARELRLPYASLHNAELFGHDLGAYARRHRLACVAYTNAAYPHVAAAAPYRAVHVIRDPRDVVVSSYFSHRYSHAVDDRWPELAARRERLQSLPMEDGLLHELDALAWQFDCMRSWRYDDPDILELPMEALTADPYQHLLRAFRFLGLVDERRFTLARRTAGVVAKGLRTVEGLLGDRIAVPVGPRRLPAERLLGLAWEHDFEKLSGGRTRGKEDTRSHYRKGTAGDWRRHFTPSLVATFKGRYPGLLAALGYEPDDAWDLGPRAAAPGAATR